MKKLFLLLAFFSTGCAYSLGSGHRRLPGDASQVYVPIFKNLTFDPGLEVPFTNALIYEFERAQTAKSVGPEQAEVEVLGEIRRITTTLSGPRTDKSDPVMPRGTVLASGYGLNVEVRVQVRRASDKSIIWEQVFTGERTYTAPAVLQGGLNTVNPLYNSSARRQNLEALASSMMAEAHDRITENF